MIGLVSRFFLRWVIYWVLLFLIIFHSTNLVAAQVPTTANSTEIFNRVKPVLTKEMNLRGLKFGNNVYFRVFKREHLFEVWIEKNGIYQLFKMFRICRLSGKLGPKLKEGDYQVPEGFYQVYPHQMQPDSNYHLAFNVGYPNVFDRAKNRTGSYIMVHGSCASVGCVAMTNPYIEEIYSLAWAAFNNGQKFFRIDIFPFRMSHSKIQQILKYIDKKQGFFWDLIKKVLNLLENDKHPERNAINQLASYDEVVKFWKLLKTASDIFEEDWVLPEVKIIKGEYVIERAKR